MKRYYITDGSQLDGISGLLQCIARNLQDAVDFIQIREKDLPPKELLALVRSALALPNRYGTKILVNARLDIALAAGAHGVHLPSDSITAAEIRRVVPPGFLIAVSTHSKNDILDGVDFAVFGPIFAPLSKTSPRLPVGLQGLREMTAAATVPVFALGGITPENALACIESGASGVAGITMFQAESKRRT